MTRLPDRRIRVEWLDRGIYCDGKDIVLAKRSLKEKLTSMMNMYKKLPPETEDQEIEYSVLQIYFKEKEAK